jgi:hypothetical protein
MPQAAVVIAALSLVTGCATREEWNTWLSHDSHFASGDHVWFSLRNPRPDTGNPQVTRADLETASQQRWWGRAVAVNSNQIVEN